MSCILRNMDFTTENITNLPAIHLIYTDPPWDDKILRQFYQWAGIPQPVSWEELMTLSFQKIAAICQHIILMEMGSKNLSKTIQLAEQAGLIYQHTFPGIYSNNISYNIVLFCPYQPDIQDHPLKNPHLSLIPAYGSRGMNFLDPFSGVGLFTRVAYQCEMNVIGYELWDKKMQNQVKWFNKHAKSSYNNRQEYIYV